MRLPQGQANFTGSAMATHESSWDGESQGESQGDGSLADPDDTLQTWVNMSSVTQMLYR